MKKTTISFLLFFSAMFGTQAQTFTLDSCQRWARENHPLLRQAGVIEQLHSLQRKSLNASNFPQITFNGRATYQSDVTKIDIDFSQLSLDLGGVSMPFPGEIMFPDDAFPEMSKDQYNVYLEIKQKIYDFGLNSKRKKISQADMEIDLQQNEVELYKIKETVNSLYFSLLALQENREILILKKQILDEHLKIAQSGVENGVLLPNERDNLQAEILFTDQQIFEIDANTATGVDLLEILTGKPLTADVKLSKPAPQSSFAANNLRPEMRLFELQKNKIDKSRKLLNNTYYPYLYAFGQGGFGRPALNMLNNSFAPYYIVGVGFQWTLWDGSQAHYDRKKLLLQKQNIDLVRENFERSLRLSTQKEQNDILKLEKLLKTDKELVDLKEKIAERSASAFRNGAATSADYIRDLNAALSAKAMMNIHAIQLIQAKINYQTILGN